MTTMMAHISHHNVPRSPAFLAASMIGMVKAFDVVRKTAKIYSFQFRISVNSVVAASPGRVSGRTISQKMPKRVEPSRDYVLPLGIGLSVLQAVENLVAKGETCCIITYGMGVYWSMAAAENFPGQIEIIDLRTLFPLDEELIFATVNKHGKCLLVSEEQQNNSFAEALAGRISKACFKNLDAAVQVIGALNLPAVPMNVGLEAAMLPNASKVSERLKELFSN